jgi:uncharacterized protein YukJ
MNYGVLKGKVCGYKRDSDSSPHSELLMEINGEKFRIAINVRSSKGPSHKRLIEYLIKQDIKHPIIQEIAQLREGWTNLGSNRKASIDYIRSNIFRANELKPVPHLVSGPNNDLFEYVEDLINHAKNQQATIYAFGERWGPEDNRDDYFDFIPGNGVHLIHMNQGDSSNNSVFSDGALLVNFPSGSVTGLFLKFQSQVWHTSEDGGKPIDGSPAVNVIDIPEEEDTIEPWEIIAKNSPYHLAQIIAAMVKPSSGPEFVTILNTTEQPLNLSDWKILDEDDRSDTIQSCVVESGYTAIIPLSGEGAKLSDKGGTITLLTPEGLKVDGVAYTKKDIKVKGKPVTFC